MREPYVNLGNSYLAKGMKDEGLDEFKKAMKVDPNFIRIIDKDFFKAYDNRGIIYARKGMLDKAIEEYQVSIMINPNSAKAYYCLACAYARKNDKDLAIQNLKKAFELDGSLKEFARGDDAFNNIKNQKEFIELINK
jgi:tetratricopeptide (TPR) repeat protein